MEVILKAAMARAGGDGEVYKGIEEDEGREVEVERGCPNVRVVCGGREGFESDGLWANAPSAARKGRRREAAAGKRSRQGSR